MPKTDLKLYSVDQVSGKKQTTTITYVNDTANSDTLKTFAQHLNSFTRNSYDSADRVQTINVDTEQVPVPATPKTEPTLTITGNWHMDGSDLVSSFTYDGDGIITAYCVTPQNDSMFCRVNQTMKNVSIYNITTSVSFTLYLTASETENYASKTVTITNPNP